MPSHASVSYLRDAVAGRDVEPELLDAMLRLFDGHDTPAVRWEQGRRPGFYKAPWLSRRLAFTAHLTGAAQVGSYPFRGVSPWECSCEEGHHLCAGLGARYVCLDLDAHNGETDTEERVRSVLSAAWSIGVAPLVFSSRSGSGAHAYVFFDRPLPTATVNAAGKHLARLAGITGRCDVIPSAQHYKGLGTLHALPLSPQWLSRGGGILYGGGLRPVQAGEVAGYLWWADTHRCRAESIIGLADGQPAADTSAPAPTFTAVAPSAMPPGSSEVSELSRTDALIFAAMRKSHPQFKRAVVTPAERWQGGRSTRDAYLVGYLRRQKLTRAGVVKAMTELDGTKAAERGAEYAWALVLAQEAQVPVESVLAGEPLRPKVAKLQRQEAPWGPWDARVAPPRVYEGFESPWWSACVQERLRTSKGRLDGIVLAHLIDRYYRGIVPRRMFFASRRGLAKRLRAPEGTVGCTLVRVRDRFQDVLRVVPGVPHPRLRLAAGFYVPEHRHNDALDWYVGATPLAR